MQAYSDPSRETEPYALPDVEVWEAGSLASSCCETEHPTNYVEACADQPCQSCGEAPTYWEAARDRAWWYWYCLPGCLPDSDPCGPFDTEAAALADARENACE